MAGDYTRRTFDPFSDHAGVKMQQGRVQLDADWNEQVEIEERRDRVGHLDTLGECRVSPQTPDAFLVEGGAGGITLGRGRLYVDGLLAENHGGPPYEFDRHLAELVGSSNLAFDEQPYVPSGDSFPDGEDTHLVYLDVWQREITAIEDPDLVEKAIGVDTTTRLQTVWQARVLEDVGDMECGDDLEAWDNLTQPSGGRLSSNAVGLPASDDPCIVSPVGGYRGTENRLYRIEIHRPGNLANATFKWSRDNGSVATSVTAIDAGRDELRVSRVGRDSVLRFSVGDWVEITDDYRELAGQPGLMRRLDDVNDASLTLVLDTPLPAGEFDEAEPGSRHMRVRRWDQQGSVLNAANAVVADVDANDGVIPTNAGGGTMVLEDGVEVTLSTLGGGEFHSGDYWLVAARAVDASVEILDSAPPVGIHHHYCRLALVTPGPEGFEIVDCREPEPVVEVGCCTFVVQPGEDIQEALDSLPDEGGCVCLKTGVHNIRRQLRIRGSHIVLHGESTGALVRRDNGNEMLEIGAVGQTLTDVRVADLRFESTTPDADINSLVRIRDSDRVHLESCFFTATNGAATGVAAIASRQLDIASCGINGFVVGVYASDESADLVVQDCRLVGLSERSGIAGQLGLIFDDEVTGACRVENNVIANFSFGVMIGRQASGSRISGNEITRAVNQPALENLDYAIVVAADGCTIEGNHLPLTAEFHGGIHLAGQHGCVAKNHIQSRLTSVEQQPLGILLGGRDSAPADFAMVRGNDLSGNQDGIVVRSCQGVRLLDNTLAGGASIPGAAAIQTTAITLDTAFETEARGQRIEGFERGIYAESGRRNHLLDNRLLAGGSGITALGEGRLEARGNTVDDMRQGGFLGLSLWGTSRVADCHFVSCGYAPNSGVGIGASALLVLGSLEITGCEVLNTGLSPDGNLQAPLAWGLTGAWALECLVESNLVTYYDINALPLDREHRALVLWGLWDQAIDDNINIGWPALVQNNRFIGPGASALVEFFELPVSNTIVMRFEDVTFSNNYCWHFSEGRSDAVATVRLHGRNGVVMGNHIKATSRFFSFDFNNMFSTYVGNVTVTGPLQFNGIPTPASDFNIQS